MNDIRTVFYCPKCNKLEINFEFDDRKNRDKITWSNPRDGYGRHITHIYCPECNYELSGFMNVLGMGDIDDEEWMLSYVKSIITGYSDGSYVDTEKLLELIRKDKRKAKGV